MADAFIGEIRAFPYTFVPSGWLPCDGRQVTVQQYSPLFAVIGITYGGNGSPLFNLPDLRGCAGIGFGAAATGSDYAIGEFLGTESVVLNGAQAPAHTHALNTKVVGYNKLPNAFKQTPDASSFPSRYLTTPADVVQDAFSAANAPPASQVQMNAGMLQVSGGSTPHENRQPYLPITYAICWEGFFPPRP